MRGVNGNLENLYVRVSNVLMAVVTKINPRYFHKVDRSLVLSKGKEAAGKLLIELQVRKSTADAAGAREFYNNLTQPLAGWEGEIRDLVLHMKLVRFTSAV